MFLVINGRKKHPIEFDDNATLTQLAYFIGDIFGLDMFGHSFVFEYLIERGKRLTYSDEEYFDEDDEWEDCKSTKTKCIDALPNIGYKLKFIQDLGDCNTFVITRQK